MGEIWSKLIFSFCQDCSTLAPKIICFEIHSEFSILVCTFHLRLDGARGFNLILFYVILFDYLIIKGVYGCIYFHLQQHKNENTKHK